MGGTWFQKIFQKMLGHYGSILSYNMKLIEADGFPDSVQMALTRSVDYPTNSNELRHINNFLIRCI